MQDWIVLVVSGVLALVALALIVASMRARSRTDRALVSARMETAELQAQVEQLSRRLHDPSTPRPVDTEFVITGLGRVAEPEVTATAPVTSAEFADLVLRETVVKAASLAHGVRRALQPEFRHRVRFEMKREVKRSRKQRRSETRMARREWEARQRATITEEGSPA